MPVETPEQRLRREEDERRLRGPKGVQYARELGLRQTNPTQAALLMGAPRPAPAPQSTQEAITGSAVRAPAVDVAAAEERRRMPKPVGGMPDTLSDVQSGIKAVGERFAPGPAETPEQVNARRARAGLEVGPPAPPPTKPLMFRDTVSLPLGASSIGPRGAVEAGVNAVKAGADFVTRNARAATDAVAGAITPYMVPETKPGARPPSLRAPGQMGAKQYADRETEMGPPGDLRMAEEQARVAPAASAPASTPEAGPAGPVNYGERQRLVDELIRLDDSYRAQLETLPREQKAPIAQARRELRAQIQTLQRSMQTPNQLSPEKVVASRENLRTQLAGATRPAPMQGDTRGPEAFTRQRRMMDLGLDPANPEDAKHFEELVNLTGQSSKDVGFTAGRDTVAPQVRAEMGAEQARKDRALGEVDAMNRDIAAGVNTPEKLRALEEARRMQASQPPQPGRFSQSEIDASAPALTVDQVRNDPERARIAAKQAADVGAAEESARLIESTARTARDRRLEQERLGQEMLTSQAQAQITANKRAASGQDVEAIRAETARMVAENEQNRLRGGGLNRENAARDVAETAQDAGVRRQAAYQAAGIYSDQQLQADYTEARAAATRFKENVGNMLAGEGRVTDVNPKDVVDFYNRFVTRAEKMAQVDPAAAADYAAALLGELPKPQENGTFEAYGMGIAPFSDAWTTRNNAAMQLTKVYRTLHQIAVPRRGS